jgi:hypothetical protein
MTCKILVQVPEKFCRGFAKGKYVGCQFCALRNSFDFNVHDETNLEWFECRAGRKGRRLTRKMNDALSLNQVLRPEWCKKKEVKQK